MLVEFQNELKVNFCNLVSISADEPQVSAAFRSGLGANWTFFSDTERRIIKQIDIPGEGYRTLRQYTEVMFELVETHTGLSARNVQRR